MLSLMENLLRTGFPNARSAEGELAAHSLLFPEWEGAALRLLFVPQVYPCGAMVLYPSGVRTRLTRVQHGEVRTMADKHTRWVARLTPMPCGSVDALLNKPLGLDVWERHADALVVAADEAQLAELERRRIAQVERLSTVAEFQARAQQRADSSEERSDQ
jgi:hypothetical protein